MEKNQRTTALLLMAVLFVFGILSPICSQSQLISQDKYNTVLINMNPNPNEEPWIAGGAIHEERANLPAKPFPSTTRAFRALPQSVDNSKLPQFRPIFNQVGGSCAQASGVAYLFTYEINLLRQLSSNTAANQYPYGFTYNFLNGGSNANGSMYYSGWSILKEFGVPNIAEYGGTLEGSSDGTKWLSGYSAYRAGMENRISDYFYLSVVDVTGITNMKRWLFDHANGSSKGGLLVFASNAGGWNLQKLPAGTEQAGFSVITKMGTSSGHAMTIAGYNDNICWDYNSDGKYTNDQDINLDGKVDVKDWEIGGVLMINSWGTGFGTSGKAFIMYKVLAETEANGGIWDNLVWGATPQQGYVPSITCKVTLTHSSRNMVKLTAGISNILTATKPTDTIAWSSTAFKYAGGALPMQGTGLSPTIEVGLDITPLLSKISGSQALFFLKIDSKGGNGTVDSISILDYTGSSMRETYCTKKNVAIASGTNLISMSIQKTQYAIKYQAIPLASIRICETRTGFSISLGKSGFYRAEIFDTRGKCLLSKSIAREQKEIFMETSNLSWGTYIIRFSSPERVYQSVIRKI